MLKTFIDDVFQNPNRFQIGVLHCNFDQLPSCVELCNKHDIPVLNLGKEIALFIDNLDDYAYLAFDVQDYIHKLIKTTRINNPSTTNNILAIYNLGIFFEPVLDLNITKLLKEYSKNLRLLLIWENQIINSNYLCWNINDNKNIIQFEDFDIKILKYEI